jgi:2-haloalkanoic acid dehalogenase type II
MDGLTVITFDGDGTLWDFTLVMRQALAAVLLLLRERLGTPTAAALTIDDLIATREQVAEEVRGRGVRLEEIRRRSFERTLQRLRVDDDDLLSLLTTTYFAHRFRGIGLYSDTRPTLERLTVHYRLGLISNGNSRAEQYGLAGHFDFTMYADECGVAKPDRTFYQAVLARAGVAAAEVLHVGDSLTNDVQGAQAMGMRTAWINRDGRHLPDSFQPDLVIARLTDLPTLLVPVEPGEGEELHHPRTLF